MGAGREHRREQHGIRAQPRGKAQFGHVMCGGKVHEAPAARGERAGRAIDAVRPPFARGQGAVGEDHHMAPRAGDPAQRKEAPEPCGIGQMVMAIDKA